MNGYRTSYLRAAVAEARKIQRILQSHVDFPISVRPVIVVRGAELQVRSTPPDGSVIRRRDVPVWFTRQPAGLPEVQVKELQRVTGRPPTWNPPPPAEELMLKTWSRYGKKRTYVNDLQGKTLGYRDELTGQVFVEDPKDVGRVREAVQRRYKPCRT